MRRKYTDKNVYESTMSRLDFIFSEFDNIYVSFSGGKDSGLLLNIVLQYIQNHAPHRTIGLFHLDYEAQYTTTTRYVDNTYLSLRKKTVPYRCCVPIKVTTCTSMQQSYWRPWDQNDRNLWVRDLPIDCFSEKDFPFYRENMWDYEFQEKFALWNHQTKKAKKTCCLVGIRTQESLNRWRAIVSDRNVNKYKKVPWTKKMADNIYNAYPIYDWITEDIWTANAQFGFDYNELYDLFHLAGVPLHKQRVASPFLSEAKDSLKLYKVIDPHVWGRMVSRVNGVNFTSIYGGTTAMGWKGISKPDHFSWKEYMEFLLATLPKDIAKNYRNKLATSIKFWRARGGVLPDEAIDDLKKAGLRIEVGKKTNYRTEKKPVRMEYADEIDSNYFSLIPTYKRMCVCILKNDHLCKYMGFTQTQAETKKRKQAIDKYMAF